MRARRRSMEAAVECLDNWRIFWAGVNRVGRRRRVRATLRQVAINQVEVCLEVYLGGTAR